MKNLIICGAPRAGTTSLFRYLAAHPDIAPSKVKELNFFLGCGRPWEDLWEGQPSIASYLEFFGGANNQWLLEASPVYMHPLQMEKTAARIARLLPDARLIMILRDPVDRLYSQYMGWRERSGKLSSDVSFKSFALMLLEGRNLEEVGIEGEAARMAGEGLRVGIYANTLNTYLRNFPSHQIKPIFTEHLGSNPLSVIKSICRWLGIDSSGFRNYTFSRENKMIQARSNALYRFALSLNTNLEPFLNCVPAIRKGLRAIHHFLNAKPDPKEELSYVDELLHPYYSPHNEELVKLLTRHWPDVSLPAWLETGR